MIRIAAVGDVHFGPDAAGQLHPHLERLADEADVLLLAGDLTRLGRAEEADVLAEEMSGLEVPCVAVLGNHDYHSGEESDVAAVMSEAGVAVLEGSSVVLEVAGCTLGVAGVKGFGGGFAGACGSDFGEREMKAFVRHSQDRADALCRQLAALATDVRVALTHYAPVEGTLRGERPEIYPFLGSYLLAEAIDGAGADLAVHGHAHGGTERAVTPGGVHVRNVAQPVLKKACAVYCIEPGASWDAGDAGRQAGAIA